MRLSARYVTQTSIYESPFLGPLTDRKIVKYIKLGYYGEQAKLRQEAKEKQKKHKVLIEFVV